MNFDVKIDKKVKYIESIIDQYLPEEKGYQKRVIEAMRYSFLAGGKRLRPMLMLETYLLFEGKNIQEAGPFMAAIEMIHTYSLVHDDLPALDNDEYRRGKHTTHVVYGEAMAVLAGDALLNYAYETACKAFDTTSFPERIIEAVKLLASKPGIYGMIGGQTVDVENCNRSMDRDTLEYIHRNKTGALIEASMMIGGVLAGASREQVKLIEKAAADIGMAFQIQDDILDVTGSTEVLGKPVHSDEKNNKTTYVTFEGMEKSKADVKRLSENAIGILQSFDYKNEFLEELIRYLVIRNK